MTTAANIIKSVTAMRDTLGLSDATVLKVEYTLNVSGFPLLSISAYKGRTVVYLDGEVSTVAELAAKLGE